MPGVINTPGYGNRNRNYTLSASGSADDVQNRQYNAGWYGGGNSSSDALAARRIAEAGGTIGGITYGTGGTSYGAAGGDGASLGGYGAGGYGVPSFIADYQRKFDEANAKNEQRYGEILGDYRSLYDRDMSSRATGNSQNIADINQTYDKFRSTSQQDMINRGLGNSTIKQTMDRGIEKERAASINRENFNYEQAKRAADQGLTTDRLNFMERRTDKAPSTSELIALAQAYGSSGAGGGAGIPAQGGGVYSGLGDGGYGSAAGTPYAGLQSALGNVFGGFSGFSHMPAVNAAQAQQTANTRNTYGFANMVGQAGGSYDFNRGYSLQGNSGSGYDGRTVFPYGDPDYAGYYYGSG